MGWKKFRNFRRNGLEMALAPDGRSPLVGMSACPASPRRRENALEPRYRGCATLRHKPGGRTLLPRKACLRRAAKMRQHALRGRAKPPCPEAPAPKGAAVLLVQGLPPRGLWPILHLPAQPADAWQKIPCICMNSGAGSPECKDSGMPACTKCMAASQPFARWLWQTWPGQ